MKPAYLKELQKQLPLLSFDPAKDRATVDWPLCSDYLEFYNFPKLPNVRHYLGKFTSLDHELACHYLIPENPKGTVCVMHGYFDHFGLYNHLTSHLLKQGYAVAGFDLPGHGISSGEQVSIQSFHHYMHTFSQFLEHIHGLPAPIHAVGQSTGGAVLINYLLLRQFLFQPIKLDKVVLLAPLVRPNHWAKVRLAYKLTGKFRKYIKRKFNPNSSDPDFLRFVKEQDPLQTRKVSVLWVGAMRQWVHDFSILPKCKHPLTVVQGDLDETVDWEYNLKVIRRKFPNTKIVMQAGAGHHLVNESRDLRDEIFAAMGF